MKTIKKYAGLEYVTVKTKKSSIDFKDLIRLESELARKIIIHRPLRGKEVQFLRKQLELSCAKLSVALAGVFDASTISRWEAQENKRLLPANEMYMRIFFAEKLGLKLNASNESLIPKETEQLLQLSA